METYPIRCLSFSLVNRCHVQRSGNFPMRWPRWSLTMPGASASWIQEAGGADVGHMNIQPIKHHGQAFA